MAARLDGRLAGIGGLTIDPANTRRPSNATFLCCKIVPSARVGRALAEKLLTGARALGRPVTVNAAAGSEPFWESLGFVAEPRYGYSHVILVSED